MRNQQGAHQNIRPCQFFQIHHVQGHQAQFLLGNESIFLSLFNKLFILFIWNNTVTPFFSRLTNFSCLRKLPIVVVGNSGNSRATCCNSYRFSNGRGREKSSSFSAVRAALTSSRLRAADERIVWCTFRYVSSSLLMLSVPWVRANE